MHAAEARQARATPQGEQQGFYLIIGMSAVIAVLLIIVIWALFFR